MKNSAFSQNFYFMSSPDLIVQNTRSHSPNDSTDEAAEFKEFIEQINELQRMQTAEQEALNQQRLRNVDLMDELFKCEPLTI